MEGTNCLKTNYSFFFWVGVCQKLNRETLPINCQTNKPKKQTQLVDFKMVVLTINVNSLLVITKGSPWL